MYTNLPNNITIAEGSQFRKLFAKLAAIQGVEIGKIGVQSHHSLGIVERYQKLLRDTYRKLKLDHSAMQRQLLLALVVKAVNDTLCPEGIVSSALVFGEFPSLRSLSDPILPRPFLAEHAQAAQESRRHMSQHLARTKIHHAHHHKILQATNKDYQPGKEVLVWIEKIVENHIGEWIGPYTFETINHSSKIVMVGKDENLQVERYNMTQVKPFL